MMGTYPLGSPESSFLSAETAIFISWKVRHAKNSVSTFVYRRKSHVPGWRRDRERPLGLSGLPPSWEWLRPGRE